MSTKNRFYYLDKYRFDQKSETKGTRNFFATNRCRGLLRNRTVETRRKSEQNGIQIYKSTFRPYLDSESFFFHRKKSAPDHC